MFESRASELTSQGDGGTTSDIYVRRMAAGTTVLVSVNASGTGGGNADSGNAVYGDGEVVAFESDASDLASNDANGTTDIYEHNLTGATTRLASVNPSGSAGNGASTWPVLEGSATYFQSDASDLVPTDTNESTDIFVNTGSSVELVSVNAAGSDSGNGPSTMPGQLAGPGFAFNSEATNLGPTDTNGAPDVYMRSPGEFTYLVSTNTSQHDSGNAASRLTTPRGQHQSEALLMESGATDLGPSVGGSSQIYAPQLIAAELDLRGLTVIQTFSSAELFYTVFNQGPATADDTVALVQLPPGLTLSPDPGSGCQSIPNSPAWVVCSMGDLPPFGRTDPVVPLTIDAPPGTVFEIRMVVGSKTHDPSPAEASVQFEFVPP